MHMLPQLRQIEQQFGHELAVIGVHSGKFHAERVTDNIQQAVMRLEIDHPVVNDRQFRVWKSWAVSAWPTLVFIDPGGRFVGSHAGEAPADALANVVRNLLQDFEARGEIDRGPLALSLERERDPDDLLRFPAKVLALPDGRLFISDSNHNRILAVHTEDGRTGVVAEVVGGVAPGFRDGGFGAAAFHRPHGLALVGDQLYVADTENHAVRAVDLAEKTVRTVAGVGTQAFRFLVSGPGPTVALSSPWDLFAHGANVFIAMAGTHQLWRVDLTTGYVFPHAGTGGESIADGPLTSALLAQPSGLASDGRRLYFADTESSAIRWADFEPGGKVGTIVGTGLFDFGDKDGAGDDVLLQHPQGVVCVDGKFYVADTYNNKIKLVDPDRRSASTFAGDGATSSMWEPGGISEANGRLYVADTNNHRIRVIDLATGRLDTLRLDMDVVQKQPMSADDRAGGE